MRRTLAIALLLITGALRSHAAAGVSVAPQFGAGVPIPAIPITDDRGRLRSTAEWRGSPTILVPMYVSCPVACPLIVEGLKKAIAESDASPSGYRVVLFSFDARDTAEDLHRFRDLHQLPLSWIVARADPDGTRRLLDAAGYRFADANGLLAHPNVIIVLTPDMKTGKYLFGTSHRGKEIDEAIGIARGRRDWVATAGGVTLALLLFGTALSSIHLFTLLGARASKLPGTAYKPSSN